MNSIRYILLLLLWLNGILVYAQRRCNNIGRDGKVKISFMEEVRTGTIEGNIIDENGDPAIGAIIEVFCGGLRKGGSVTDNNGHYILLRLPIGTYQLTAKYSNHKNIRINDIVVNSDSTTRVSIKFKNDYPQEVVIPIRRYCGLRDEFRSTTWNKPTIELAPTRDMIRLKPINCLITIDDPKLTPHRYFAFSLIKQNKKNGIDLSQIRASKTIFKGIDILYR